MTKVTLDEASVSRTLLSATWKTLVRLVSCSSHSQFTTKKHLEGKNREESCKHHVDHVNLVM